MQASDLRTHPAEKADGWVVGLHGAAPGQRQGLRHHDAVQRIFVHYSHPAPDQRLHMAESTWPLPVSARMDALSIILLMLGCCCRDPSSASYFRFHSHYCAQKI